MGISLRDLIGLLLHSLGAAWWIWLIYAIKYVRNVRTNDKKPKFRWYLLSGVSYGLVISLLKIAGSSTSPQEGASTYVDPRRGVKLEYPSSWTIEELAGHGVLLLLSPAKEAGWQTNIFVELRSSWSRSPTIERLRILVDTLSKEKAGFSLQSSRVLTHASGLPAGELIYSHLSQGVPLTEKELILWLDHERVLFMTGSVVTSLWTKYEPEINLVLESVRPTQS